VKWLANSASNIFDLERCSQALIDTTQQGPTPALSPEGGKGTNFQNADFLLDYEIMDEDQTVSNPNKIHENSCQNSLQMTLFLIF